MAEAGGIRVPMLSEEPRPGGMPVGTTGGEPVATTGGEPSSEPEGGW